MPLLQRSRAAQRQWLTFTDAIPLGVLLLINATMLLTVWLTDGWHELVALLIIEAIAFPVMVVLVAGVARWTNGGIE